MESIKQNKKENKKGEPIFGNIIWLTRKQASSYLQCSLSFLDIKCEIKKYYLGKSVRYLKSDIDEYLISNINISLDRGKKC